MSVFKDQDYDIELVSNVDFSTASSLKIRYEKPDSTGGEISATAGGVGNQTVTGAITDTINNQIGSWHFQIYALMSDSRVYYSNRVKVECKESIQVSV